MSIEPALSSDRERYRVFYKETVRIVARHLSALGVKNQADLEDLVQDTYVEAYKAWDTIHDGSKRVPWLLTIARRRWMRHLAQKKRQSTLHGPVDARSASVIEDCADPNGRDIDQQLGDRSLCVVARQALDTIRDPERRRAVELFYFDGESLGAVAQATGVNSSTLTTWLSRYRAEAKKLIHLREQVTPSKLLATTLVAMLALIWSVVGERQADLTDVDGLKSAITPRREATLSALRFAVVEPSGKVVSGYDHMRVPLGAKLIFSIEARHLGDSASRISILHAALPGPFERVVRDYRLEKIRDVVRQDGGYIAVEVDRTGRHVFQLEIANDDGASTHEKEEAIGFTIDVVAP